MRRYEKPVMQVERFAANTAVAASCNRTYSSTQITVTYPVQTVTCVVGGQTETVFTSDNTSCKTSASKTALGTYDGVEYFCWYAPGERSGGAPTDAQKLLMATIILGSSCSQQEAETTASGWHYCPVNSLTNKTDIMTNSY